jgi:hypothetical protein
LTLCCREVKKKITSILKWTKKERPLNGGLGAGDLSPRNWDPEGLFENPEIEDSVGSLQFFAVFLEVR